MRRLILTLIFLCWATSGYATTYYVRTDGLDSHTGTTNTAGGAWLTINKCADTVAAGDVCRIQAGTYVEVASPGVSGTAGNTVTIVADGVVTSCGMDFNAKSYIRVIGITFNPATGGCSPTGSVITASGTNTGLEFWNVDIGSNAEGKGYLFYNSGTNSCNKCLFIGGSIHNIGGGAVADTALVLHGDDDYVGYMDFATICYIGVGQSGSRQRLVNLNFSGFIQCSGSHPDFFYAHQGALAYSNGLIESLFGIGTSTSSDNKTYHINNAGPTGQWIDNVFRFNVVDDMGSGYYSFYSDGGTANLRFRFYNDTIVDCSRANLGVVRCGNFTMQAGGSASLRNTLFSEAWSTDITSGIDVWSVTSGTVTADYNAADDPDGSVTFDAQWTNQAHEQSNVDPGFNNRATRDFTLTSGSGMRGVGGPLTTAVSCSGTTLNVASGTGSFFIGDNSANIAQYGGALAPGDFLTINSTTYQVVSRSTDALTLSASLSCSNGDAVYFGNSATIDIGAYPYKSTYALTATYSCSGTCAVVPNDSTLVRFVVCYDSGVPYTIDNTSPYSCATATGTFTARVYPQYASATPYALATDAGAGNGTGGVGNFLGGRRGDDQ